MHNTKVIATCIFNELLAAGLFPALDGTSMRTDPSISRRKYRKSVCNAVFIRNKSLNVVSAAAMSTFQLKHTLRLLRSICPVGYQIWTIKYGKILVMLLYGKYYWRVYEVYSISIQDCHICIITYLFIYVLELGGIMIFILVSINLILAYIPIYSELLTQSPPFHNELYSSYIGL